MEMTTNERPLMSFAILAYKQERFIGEAVAGALAQTYSPLEIILSDDHSTDRTFEVMQEIAGAYRGPHQLVLNQTLHNRGICAHVNRIVELAKGEMIVGSAGDDISLPERTELCYRAWSDSGRRSASIWSDYLPIDESGNVVGEGALRSDGDAHARFEHLQTRAVEVAAWRAEVAYGCTQAWSAEIFRVFGPLPAVTGLVNEDGPIFFRAALLAGQATRINTPLVRYRRHSGNCSIGLTVGGNVNVKKSNRTVIVREREIKRLMAVAKCYWRDTRRALELGLICSDDAEQLAREVARSYRAFQLRTQLLEAGKAARLKLVWKLARLGRGRKFVLRELCGALRPEVKS
jgi:glycosyltransferase involved in cell wall biosynthesis